MLLEDQHLLWIFPRSSTMNWFISRISPPSMTSFTKGQAALEPSGRRQLQEQFEPWAYFRGLKWEPILGEDQT